MKRLPSCPLILLFAVLFLAVIFLALDFKLSFSLTTDDTEIVLISPGDMWSAENQPLVIFVQAPGNLAGPLRQALFNRVGTLAPFSTIELIESREADPGSAVLVVVVDRRTYIWTPVYAVANLSVQVAFASDGRVDWNRLGEVDTLEEASPTILRLSGDWGIRDYSVGLVSHPGYRSFISEQISEGVVNSIGLPIWSSSQ